MKVKELIEKLSQLDPELMVVVRGYEGGVDEVSDYGLCNIWLKVYYLPFQLVLSMMVA